MKGRRCAGACHAGAYAPAFVVWTVYAFHGPSGARRSRSCAKRAIVVRRKWLRHKENVRRVGARPELVPSVLRTGAPARILEDVVASMNRCFLFVIFFAVFLESMKSTVKYRMAWLAGVQALRGAAEWLSGPSQAA